MKNRKKGIDFNSILMSTGGAVIGGCGGAVIKNTLGKSLNSKLTEGLTIAVGALLPVIAGDSDLIKSIGAGLAAVGGQKLLADVTGSSYIAGDSQIPTVAINRIISGVTPSVANNSALSGRKTYKRSVSGIQNPDSAGIED